jgi:hypothetical protein
MRSGCQSVKWSSAMRATFSGNETIDGVPNNMFARLCTTLVQMIAPHSHCLCLSDVLAGFYMMCMMTKNVLINHACGNKIINKSLTPYYQIRYTSPVLSRNSLELHQTASQRRENATNKHGCSTFLLIKGTCAQTQYKIPYFYQPFDLSNIEFRSVPVDEQDPARISASI